MSQQRRLGWGKEASSRPGAGLSLLPAWLPRLGHCFGTDVREHIPGTGQHRPLKGFSLLLPFLSPPHTRASIFPSCCKTKTLHSRVQELRPNGRSQRRRGWDMEAAQAQGGQGLRTPPAHPTPTPPPAGPCWGLLNLA